MASSPIQSILKIEDLTSEEDAHTEYKDEFPEEILIEDDESMPAAQGLSTNTQEVIPNAPSTSTSCISNVQQASQSITAPDDTQSPSVENRISFKIVQITEHGKTYLTTVPSAWERLGHLYWPNITNVFIIQKLLQNSSSKPEKYWFSQPCKLKRANFKTFEDAEVELKKIEAYEDSTTQFLRTQKRHQISSKVVYDDDDDSMNSIISNHKVFEETSKHIDVTSSSFNHTLSQRGYKFRKDVKETEELDIGCLLKNISQNMNQILQNQNKMLMDLANQRIYNDVITDHLNQISNRLNVHKSSSESSAEIEKPMNKDDCSTNSNIGSLDFPISNQKDLDELEFSLNDSKIMECLISKMKRHCGEAGTFDATNCCYHLVDRFFTRSFMVNVSWSGGSRTESKKLALKNYRNILCVFNTLIILASNDFDEFKSREFFKTVLKNAKKRYVSEIDHIPRKSAKKVRKKGHEKVKVHSSDGDKHDVSVTSGTAIKADDVVLQKSVLDAVESSLQFDCLS